MITIQPSFIKRGFHHQQIERRGEWAVFRRWKNANPPCHYEVVRIREHGEYQMAGVTIPAGESYPSSEKWGADGFTFTTLEKAMAKFEEVAK